MVLGGASPITWNRNVKHQVEPDKSLADLSSPGTWLTDLSGLAAASARPKVMHLRCGRSPARYWGESTDMAGKRASVLHNWMGLIDMYTMSRALTNLTQEEFDWEPHPGAWGVRRREACRTPSPSGEAGSAWVSDNDWELKASADRGEALEPMTTIGWLLNHFGAAPGLTADLDFLGGSTVPTHDVYARMWGHTNIPTVDVAVTRFQEGWSALIEALRHTTDEMLEADCDGHPWKRGDRAVAALLNEVSHHGTQICMLRDLFAHQSR